MFGPSGAVETPPPSYESQILQRRIDEKIERLKRERRKRILQKGQSSNTNEKRILMQRVKGKLLAMQRLRADRTARSSTSTETQPFQFKTYRNYEELMDMIDAALIFQQRIIELGDFCCRCIRLHLLVIIFQSTLGIIFNAYNLVSHCMHYNATAASTSASMESSSSHGGALSLELIFIFYGYLVTMNIFNVLMTIVAASAVYNSIKKSSLIVNELTMYVSDELLKSRLLQYERHVTMNLRVYSVYDLYTLDGSFIRMILSSTVTYIILLMQYDSGDDVQGEIRNAMQNTSDSGTNGNGNGSTGA